MKLIFEIAIKFLFGKKSKGIINVISTISIVGVSVGTMALLVILSVFNGLHGLIGSLYDSFDSDMKISLVEGKYFSTDSIQLQKIRDLDEVLYIAPVVEDNALLKYDKREVTGIIMGVDSIFTKVSNIDSIVVDGKFSLVGKQGYEGVIGYVLADQLNLRLNFLTPLFIYVPRRDKKINLMRPNEVYNSHYIFPKGIFLVKQVEYDSQYLIIDINLARNLFQYKPNEVTSLSILLRKNANIEQVQHQIRNILGSQYKIDNRQEQHASFYKMMRVEKIMAYLILCFVLIIATFNLIGTMSMLIFDKREGIKILKSIGANKRMVIQVFLFEGWLISLIGVGVGLLLGVILVLVQQYFGIVGFSGASAFVVDAYPVILNVSDVFYTLITVTSIGFIAAWYPVRVIVGKYYDDRI